MANNFNILARVQLQGPNNVRQVARQIQSQLQGIRANVQVGIANGTNQRLNTLNTNLQRIDASLRSIRLAAVRANQELITLSNTINTLRNAGRNINVNTRLTQVANAAANAGSQMRVFGEQAALAVRRFAAFAAPTSIFLGLVAAIKEGVSEAIEFEKEMIRLSQVTGKGLEALSGLSGEITRLSTSLGVSSKDLGNVATTLAQAGLSAKKTTVALEALARSSLAATFTSIEDTTEGAIAVFRQFNVEAEDLQGVIGSLNSVSAQFAVESDDLVSVIRRTGGAFKASGGSLNELLGLFTSVRATTRESADSIATGFRTIFTRIQRPRTIQFLRELGVELQDAKGQFIGPLESIRRLNAALSEIQTTDPRFAAVIEELGGFRQVSKVIPLIQQFPEALKAISVAEQGQQSIVEDSIIAQKSLANQIAKVKEEFLALFRELTSDKSFQVFVRTVLDLAKGLIDVTRALKPLIPLLGGIAVIQGARSLSGLGQGFLSGLRGGNQGRTRRFEEGGVVPGTGNSDTVPAMLTPGEFVVKKSAAKAIGFSKLASMNKFAKGGKQKKKKSPFSKTSDDTVPTDEFAIAGLIPQGGPKGSRIPRTENFKYEQNGVSENIRLYIGVLSQSITDQLEGIYKKSVYSGASQASDVLKRTLGIEKNNTAADIGNIAKKAGMDNIVGSLFEQSLALAGAPYQDKQGDRDPIDFINGVGAKLASGFGIPSDVKTDAKRTATSKDFKRRNLLSYLKKKHAAVGGDILEKKAKSSAQSLAKGLGRTNIIASASAESTSKENFEKAYNSLTPEQQAEYAGLVEKGSRTKIQEKYPGTGLFYLTKSKASGYLKGLTTKKETGGEIPGIGNEDKVPALLTPGEFVINKDAARIIGSNKLNQLNNADKVQKFALGGSVGGRGRGNFSGGFENAGFAVAAMTSLITSFSSLDKQTQKVVDSFSAVAVSTAGLSFALRSITSERRIANLQRRPVSSVDPTTGAITRRGTATSTLARNFDAVAGAASIVSSALVVFGQNVQDSALAAAKNAQSQAELDKAISSDKFGSTASGAGVGAGLGAAIGTAIAPGIGTAIGAGIGLLTGGIVGAMNSNNKELIKAFNQAGFDKTTEKLGDLFDDFSSKRKSIGESALGISTEASSALSRIKDTTDIEQRKNLTKELKGQIVNYRTLSSAIIENVSDLNQFKSAFGSSGQKLIESIAFLTNKSFKEIEKEIQNEIDARNISVRAIQQQTAVASQLKAYTVSIKTLSESLLSISDSVNAAQDTIDELTSSIEGGFSNAKVNSNIPGDFFSRVASGSVQNIASVTSAAKQLTATLDTESQNAIVSQVTSVAKLSNELPNILKSVADTASLTGGDSAEGLFRDAIDKLTGVDSDIKNVVKTIFGTELASRENSGEAGFKKVAREDILGLADKLLPDALKSFVEELDTINKSTQNIFNSINERMTKANQLQLNLTKQRMAIEERVFELSKFRLAEFKDAQLSDVSNAVSRKRNLLIQGTGLRPNAGAAEAFSRLNRQIDERERQRGLVASSPAGTTAQNEAQIKFQAANNEVVRLTEYLKDLGSSTEELTFLQDKLSKAEQDRAAGKDLIKGLLFGGGANRAKFADTFTNLKDVQGGRKNLLDFTEDQANDIFDLIGKLPQNKESKFLGGVKPEEFINKQIGKSIIERAKKEGSDPAKAQQLVDEFTQRSKEESDLRAKADKLMEDAITADKLLANVNERLITAFNNFNTQSLAQLPQLITNAIADAQARQFTELAKGKQSELTDVQSRKTIAENLANSIGVSTSKFQGAGQRIEANKSNLQTLAGAIKTKNEFSKETDFNKILAVSQITGADTKGSRIGFDKLDPAKALDITRKSLESAGLGDDKELLDKLQAQVAAISFDTTGLRLPGKSDFGDQVVSAPGFNGLNKEKASQGLARFIQGEIDKFKASKVEDATKQETETRKKIEENLTPEFGTNTKAIIERFLDPAKLQAFSDSFAKVNVPFDTLEQNSIILGNQFNALAAQAKAYSEQIKKPPVGTNTVLRAEEKAAGGWINGRGINSPMTTFTPRGSDKIPAILSRGEFVVNARAAQANAGLLNSLNAQGFARGGRVKMTKEQYEAQKAAKAAAFAQTNLGKATASKLLARKEQFDKNKARNQAEYANRFEAKNVPAAGLRGEAARAYFEQNPGAGFEGLSRREGGSREISPAFTSTSGRLIPAVREKNDLVILPGDADRAAEEALKQIRARRNAERAKPGVANAVGSGIQGLFGLSKAFSTRISNYRYQGDNARAHANSDFQNNIGRNSPDSNYGRYDDIGKVQYDREFKRLRGFASGGPVPGSGNRDSVPALLTPGEFVLNRRAAKSLGLHSLSNFNQRFATGGVVTGGGGGAAGGTLNINPQALATLEKFYGTFSAAIDQFGSNIGIFAQTGNSLSAALSNWGGAATRLSEALSSMPHEIQVSHAPMNVVISVTGLETFRQEITNEVLTAMDQRLATQRNKATDGKSPFMSK